LRHERVGFWAAFAHARFDAVRAVRDDVFSEDLKQLVQKSGLFARLVVGDIERVGPLTQGIDGALEAEW
jgi:hypothetical protein